MVKRKKEKPKENLHTRIEHLFELINGATIKSEPVSDSSLEIKIGEFEDLPDFEKLNRSNNLDKLLAGPSGEAKEANVSEEIIEQKITE